MTPATAHPTELRAVDRSIASTCLEAALDYAESYGWRCFPCRATVPTSDKPKGGKLPIGSDRFRHPAGGSWKRHATADGDQLRALWATAPGDLLAVATGEASGVLVVDLDTEAAVQWFDRLTIQWKDPPTVRARTSSGVHLFYAYPKGSGIGNSAEGLRQLFSRTGGTGADAIDVRGEGGLLVLPPSLHPTGVRYQWQRSPAESQLADPPEWLLSALTAGRCFDGAPDRPEPGAGLPSDVAELLQAIPSDDYSDWIRVGAALHYCDPVEGLELWDRWSRTSTKYAGRHDIETRWRGFRQERATSFHGAQRPHATEDTLRKLAAHHSVDLSSLQLNGSRQTHALDAQRTPDRWERSSVSRFLEAEPPPIEWVVPDFLPLGVVGMLAGAGGVMKSQSALQLAVSVALGRDWLGVGTPEPGSVLVLAAEDSELQLHHRVQRLRGHLNLTAEELDRLGQHMHVIPLVGQEVTLTTRPAGGEVGLTELCEKVANKANSLGDCRLIVLDNKSRMMAGDENAAEDATRFVQGVERIVEQTGATALVVAHVNKTAIRDGGGQEALRGSSAAVDGARWVATMARLRSDQGSRYGLTEAEAVRYIRLDVPKSNYTAPFAGVWLHNDEGVLVPTELVKTKDLQDASKKEADLRHALAELEAILRREGALSKKKLRPYARTSGRLGISEAQLDRLLARGQREGRIKVTPNPRGKGELVHLPGWVAQ